MMSNATLRFLYECDRHDRFVCVVCVNSPLYQCYSCTGDSHSRAIIPPTNVKDVLFGPNEYVAVTKNVRVYIMSHTEDSFEPCQHNCCALEK